MDKGRAGGLRTTIYTVNKDWAILNTAYTFSRHYNNKGALVGSFWIKLIYIWLNPIPSHAGVLQSLSIRRNTVLRA